MVFVTNKIISITFDNNYCENNSNMQLKETDDSHTYSNNNRRGIGIGKFRLFGK